MSSTSRLNVFEGNRLPSLDGLRFIAATMVVLGHGGIGGWMAGDGVTIFFVLSGLLFSWMFQKEWEKHKALDFRTFYLRRTFRIIPAMYAAILVTITGKLLLHAPVNFYHAASAATFTGNYYNAFHGHPPTGFDLLWSLGVEEQFYLVWPLCFAYFMGKGPRALARFLVVAILAVFTWRSTMALVYHADQPYLYNAFETRFDNLAAGCLFGLVMMSPKATPFLKAITRTGLEPLVPLAGIYLLDNRSYSVRFSFGLTAQCILAAILLVQLVILHEHRLWSWLNHRVLIFLGTLSYSTYLYHGWGLTFGDKLSFLPLFPKVMAGLGFSLFFAYLSYRFVEKPLLELRKRFESRFTWTRGRRSSSPAAAAASLTA